MKTRPRIAPAARIARLNIPAALWLLLLITLAGGLLRFIGLGSQSLWLDEFLTWSFALAPVEELRGALRLEPHPPLYFLSAWAWTDIVGRGDEIGLRSLSALLGTATVPLVYAAAVTRLSRTAALLAALFVAVSPFAVWYSQEARPYAMLGALCALSLVCLLHALESPRRWAWAWAIASSLALATHYFAGFLIALEALWLLRVLGWRAVWAPAALVLATELLMVAYLATVDTFLVDWVRWIPRSDRLQLIPVEFVTGLQSLDLPSDAAIRFWIASAVAVGGLAAACAFRSERTAARPFLVFAAAVILLPLAIAIVKPSTDYVLARYLFAAQAPLLIAVAAGLAARRAGRVGVVAGLALAGILLSLTLSIAARPEFQRADWRSVSREIGPASVPRALVVRRWLQSMPLLAYVPRLSVVYKERETGVSKEENRQRAQTPLSIAEIVVLAFGTRPEGAPVPGFRLTGWRNDAGAIHATYASPEPVSTTPAALTAGVARLFGKPRTVWDAPLVYLQGTR